MNKQQKQEIAEEVLKNMDITKEQYIELCRLCDDFGLERIESTPPEPSWDEIIGQ